MARGVQLRKPAAEGERRRGRLLGWAVVLGLIAAFTLDYLFVRPALMHVLGVLSGGHPALACMLGWLTFGLPLWTALAAGAVATALRRPLRPPGWLMAAWAVTFVGFMSLMPPRGRGGDYERELVEHAGRVGHAIGLGVGAGLLGILAMIPVFALGGLLLRRLHVVRRLRTDRAWSWALGVGAVTAQVGMLALVMSRADLVGDPDAFAPEPSAGAPHWTGPAFSGRPAPRALEYAPQATLQLSATTGWDRLAVADSPGCTSAADAATTRALAQAGCRGTARVLLADPARGLVGALSAVDLGSAEVAKRVRESLPYDAAALPLPLPAGRVAAPVAAAYDRLAVSSEDRTSSTYADGPVLYLKTVAAASGQANGHELAVAELELGGLDFAYANYLPVPARFPAGSDLPAPTGTQLFPSSPIALSELGTWRRLATSDGPGCAGAVRDPDIAATLTDGNCRRTSRVLLADPARHLMAAVTVIDVDPAEAIVEGFGVLRKPQLEPLPLPAGADPVLAQLYAILADPAGNRSGLARGRGRTLAMFFVAGPGGPTDDTLADGRSEFDHWLGGYLSPAWP